MSKATRSARGSDSRNSERERERNPPERGAGDGRDPPGYDEGVEDGRLSPRGGGGAGGGGNGGGGDPRRTLRSQRSPERPSVGRTNSEGAGGGGGFIGRGVGGDPRYDTGGGRRDNPDHGAGGGGSAAGTRSQSKSWLPSGVLAAKDRLMQNLVGPEPFYDQEERGNAYYYPNNGRNDGGSSSGRGHVHFNGGHSHHSGPYVQDADPPSSGGGGGASRSGRAALQRELEEMQEKNSQLLEQLGAFEEMCQQLKRRNDAMQSSKDAQESLLGRQVQDESISVQFNDIFAQIKAWAGKFCRDANRTFDVSAIPLEMTPAISRVIPRMRTLDELPQLLPQGDLKKRRKFVRGWIALNVAETMFRTLPAPTHGIEAGSDVWIPEQARTAIKTLELSLLNSGEAVTRTAFHEWRALTLALFDKMYPASRWPAETVTTIDSKVQATLGPILSLGPSAAAGTVLAEFSQRLVANVFVPAVELSQVLRRQRACWYVRFLHVMTANVLPSNAYTVPYIFNRDLMRDVDADEDGDDEFMPGAGVGGGSVRLKAVDIVISPGLFKSGNHDGMQYDSEYPVEKAEVSCTEIIKTNELESRPVLAEAAGRDRA